MPKFRRTKKYIAKTRDSMLLWSNFSLLKTGGNYIQQAVLNLVPQKPVQPDEDFDAVLKRYNLTEADLAKKARRLGFQCLLYLVGAVFVFFYGCYLLASGHIYAFFASTLLAIMIFSFAFQAHFWRYQIKKRSLGCSYNQWLSAVLRGEV